MRRIALYSDVHGNTLALQAVFKQIAHAGISERYCLGDLVGLGPEPNEAVTMVRASGDPVVQGNYDEAIGLHLCTPGSDFPTPQEALDGAESYAFTVSEITRETADFLHTLPSELRLQYEQVRILLCHGTPGDSGGMLAQSERPARVIEQAESALADVVCSGHTHVPFHRSIPTLEGAVHWVNAGSVGRPRDGDPRACWVELVLGEHGEVLAHTPADTACRQAGATDVWLGVWMHRVPYDVERVLRTMDVKGLPHTLALGLRLAREEHDARQSVAVLEPPAPPEGTVDVLPCGHTRDTCSCMYDDRVAAYESLSRLYRGDISEVAASVRRLRMAMRGCKVNRHVDEEAILAAFEGADLALRTLAGRSAFIEERERLYGLRAGFDPFTNVLSAEEMTYLSGDVQQHLAAIEQAYIDGSFTMPEILPGERVPGHISTELAFMAHCLRGAAAGDARALERGREFFAGHLAEWAMLFAVVIGQQALEPVMRYAGLALDKHLTCEAPLLRYEVPLSGILQRDRGPG